MAGLKPDIPSAGNVTRNQLRLGKKAALFGQRLNMVDQKTPTGSIRYRMVGKKNPHFKVTTSLTQPEQALLGAGEKTGLSAINAAGGIIDQNAGRFAAGPDISGKGITDRIMGWGQDYLQPVFNQQNESLESKLRNQGIAPGSEAYTNAMRDLSRNQNDAYTQLLLQGQNEAISAGRAAYLDPLSAYSTLLSGSGPSGVSAVQTPQTQVQTPDYQTAATNEYNAKAQQSNNLISGLFSVPTTLLGGWARGVI